MEQVDPIPELPFADGVLELAARDLDASRNLLQRLLSLADGLLATALAVASLFGGLALTGSTGTLAWLAAPLVLVLGYLDGANWVHFRRVSHRIRAVEHLFHAYLVVLRETQSARKQAIENLSAEIDRYQFGIERTFLVPGRRDIWRVNRGRARWWIFGLVAALLVVLGAAVAQQDGGQPVCLALDDGSVVEVDGTFSVLEGTATLSVCPPAAERHAG